MHQNTSIHRGRSRNSRRRFSMVVQGSEDTSQPLTRFSFQNIKILNGYVFTVPGLANTAKTVAGGCVPRHLHFGCTTIKSTSRIPRSAPVYTSILTHTIRGKILEGENFSELMALKSLARKNLANLLVVY